jgi:hypothetical protein
MRRRVERRIPVELQARHKPKGKKLGSGTTALAKREKPVVIDQELEPSQLEYVSCEISVSQLDKIYNLLPASSKAIAVLNGVEDLA